ncbi:MAG TPA: hypothetical protein VET85_13620 [Stellaceae bacterium]|nr:hypothetical protein [Stellaceae bacterium]
MEWIAVCVILAIVAGVMLSLPLSPLTILMFGRAPKPTSADTARGYVASDAAIIPAADETIE